MLRLEAEAASEGNSPPSSPCSGSRRMMNERMARAMTGHMLGATLSGEKGKPEKKARSKVVNQLEAIDHHLKGVDSKLPWIKTSQAHTIFGAVILANAAFIGIDVELGVDGFNLPMWLTESLFLVIFCIEISLRLWAERPTFLHFFDAWGIFDFAVTLIGCVDAWVITVVLGFDDSNGLGSLTVLRMLRLVRLVRLVRVLRMFSELVVLVQTIASSIMAVAWMSLLLFLTVYTGSILTVLLIGQPNRLSPQGEAKLDADIERYFGTLSGALFTHFCVVTLENWPDIAEVAMRLSPWWSVYFVGIIVFTNFALVNLMVGVIVQRIIKLSREQESELASFAAESRQFRNTLQTLFNSVELNLDNEVATQDLRDLLTKRETHDVMSAFGINLSIPSDVLYTIMDIDREGTTTFQEFFDACIRLCGSQQSVHSVFVQHDICKSRRDLSTHMERISKSVDLRASPGQADSKLPPNDRMEAHLHDILHQLDKLGQSQDKMLAEVGVLKEHAIHSLADNRHSGQHTGRDGVPGRTSSSESRAFSAMCAIAEDTELPEPPPRSGRGTSAQTTARDELRQPGVHSVHNSKKEKEVAVCCLMDPRIWGDGNAANSKASAWQKKQQKNAQTRPQSWGPAPRRGEPMALVHPQPEAQLAR